MMYINLLDGLYLDKGTQCDNEEKTSKYSQIDI